MPEALAIANLTPWRTTSGRGRLSAARRGYDRRWRARAALFLQQHPLCGDRMHGARPVMSQCYDAQPRRIVLARQVDHVVPHRGDRRLFDDETNWQALCARCGARKSAAGL